jgi:hypothetical protein
VLDPDNDDTMRSGESRDASLRELPGEVPYRKYERDLSQSGPVRVTSVSARSYGFTLIFAEMACPMPWPLFPSANELATINWLPVFR